MLAINIKFAGHSDTIYHEPSSGPIELGRKPEREERYQIKDPTYTVARRQLLIEEVTRGEVAIENISGRTPVYCDNTILEPRQIRAFPVPISAV